jgi:hypothetical protein
LVGSVRGEDSWAGERGDDLVAAGQRIALMGEIYAAAKGGSV